MSGAPAAVPGLEVVAVGDLPARELFDFSQQVIFSPAERGEGYIKFALTRGRKGARSQPHAHPCDEVTYTISGEAELHAGGQTFRMTPGTAVRIPPGLDHTVEVISEEWVVIAAYCDECSLCIGRQPA